MGHEQVSSNYMSLPKPSEQRQVSALMIGTALLSALGGPEDGSSQSIGADKREGRRGGNMKFKIFKSKNQLIYVLQITIDG